MAKKTLTPEAKVLRGKRALRVLSDPTIREALEQVREDVKEAIVTTPASATDERERLFKMAIIVDSTLTTLAEWAEDGAFEEEIALTDQG